MLNAAATAKRENQQIYCNKVFFQAINKEGQGD